MPEELVKDSGKRFRGEIFKRAGWELLWETLVSVAHSHGRGYVDGTGAAMLRLVVANTALWDELQAEIITEARRRGSTAQPFNEGGRIVTLQAHLSTDEAKEVGLGIYPPGAKVDPTRILIFFRADTDHAALSFMERLYGRIIGVFDKDAREIWRKPNELIPAAVIRHARLQHYPASALEAETDAAIRLALTLWLRCVSFSGEVAIMGPMERVWSEFMLHSQAYRDYCRVAIGMPAGTVIARDPDTCNDPERYRAVYALLQRAYEVEMGYMPGSARRLWPHPRLRLVR